MGRQRDEHRANDDSKPDDPIGNPAQRVIQLGNDDVHPGLPLFDIYDCG